MDLVDQVVEGVVLARLAQPDAASLLREESEVYRLREEADKLREQLDELAVLLAEGVLTPTGVRAASARLHERLTPLQQQLDVATRSDELAALVTADDVDRVWRELPLTSRRAVVDTLMSVTVLPAGKGAQFHPEQIRVEWRTQ